jgi:tRNA(adenine34) deaminase
MAYGVRNANRHEAYDLRPKEQRVRSLLTASRFAVRVSRWLGFCLIFCSAHSYIVSVLDEFFMELCLTEARGAYAAEEVPVGALVVSPEGKLIARTHNLTMHMKSPVAHAEVLAIMEAAKVVENFRLVGCTLYVTKEPCIMCAGAIMEARIKRLVFGCFDAKRGAFGSRLDVNKLALNHKVEVLGGVLREPSEALLQQFFRQRRGTEAVITGPTRNRLIA